MLHGKAFADGTILPYGKYATTIVFQDNGERETGTLTFNNDGTLVETNSAVPGNHYGTWTSTGATTFSLTFSETLPNGFVVVVNQPNDQFTTEDNRAFTGVSHGTVYNGSTVVGQRTAQVTGTQDLQ